MQCIFVWFCLNLFFLIGELVPNSRIFIVYENACSIYVLAEAFFSFTLSECPQKCHCTIYCYLLASVNPQVPHCTEKYWVILFSLQPLHTTSPIHYITASISFSFHGCFQLLPALCLQKECQAVLQMGGKWKIIETCFQSSTGSFYTGAVKSTNNKMMGPGRMKVEMTSSQLKYCKQIHLLSGKSKLQSHESAVAHV